MKLSTKEKFQKFWKCTCVIYIVSFAIAMFEYKILHLMGRPIVIFLGVMTMITCFLHGRDLWIRHNCAIKTGLSEEELDRQLEASRKEREDKS